MMIAHNLRRKDYTNSARVVGLRLKHSAGFMLKRRITTRSRKWKRERESKTEKDEEEEQNI